MTSSNGTLIKMQGVSKIFFTDELETHALSAINLELKKGEYLAIAGPSGCGKSTVLAISLVHPDRVQPLLYRQGVHYRRL